VVSIADLAHLVRDVIAQEKPVRILGRTKADIRDVHDIKKVQKELEVCVIPHLKKQLDCRIKLKAFKENT